MTVPALLSPAPLTPVAIGQTNMTGYTVLQVVPKLGAGGAETTTLEITEAICAAGGTALIATQAENPRGPMEARIIKTGGEIIYLPVASKNPITVWRNIGRLARLIRARHVDIIHARSRAPAWSSLFAARRTNIACLATYHGLVHPRPAAKVFYNSALTRGAAVIANSAYTGQLIADVHGVPPDRIKIIPRGCDVDALAHETIDPVKRAAKRRQWGVPDDAFAIICPARLRSIKGQHILIETLSQLRVQALPYLVLVGGAQEGSTYQATLERLVRARQLGNRVVFAGLEHDMPVAYAASNLAVLASTRPEPFGRTIIEAQAACLPVIASDAGGFRETVITGAPIDGATGWLVAPNDVSALATALDEALALPPDQFTLLGQNGRTNAWANFTTATLCARTLSVYRELVDT